MTVWHTPATAAEHVRVSTDLIKDAVKVGELPAFAIGKGREYRLREDDIDSWMASKSWEPRGVAS